MAKKRQPKYNVDIPGSYRNALLDFVAQTIAEPEFFDKSPEEQKAQAYDTLMAHKAKAEKLEKKETI